MPRLSASIGWSEQRNQTGCAPNSLKRRRPQPRGYQRLDPASDGSPRTRADGLLALKVKQASEAALANLRAS
jgi:hypothetical protein